MLILAAGKGILVSHLAHEWIYHTPKYVYTEQTIRILCVLLSDGKLKKLV